MKSFLVRKPLRRYLNCWMLCLLWMIQIGCFQSKKTTPTAEKAVNKDASSNKEVIVERKTPPEKRPLTGFWAADKIIDIHAHIGTFAGFDLSLSNLRANQDRFGVALALISNIDGANLPGTTANLNETKANQATVNAVRQFPDRLRGIAWSRPNDGSPSKLEPFLKMKLRPGSQENMFVAIKFHPNMNQFDADNTKLDGYMKLCEKYGLAAVFHGGGRGEKADPVKIYRLAQRFPKVPVVLYHMGFGGSHAYSLDIVKEAVEKKTARLYLGTAQATAAAVLKAVKTVGSQYVMFGTDATYYGKQHYEQYKDMVSTLRKQLSATDFQNVMRNNARRIFRLP